MVDPLGTDAGGGRIADNTVKYVWAVVMITVFSSIGVVGLAAFTHDIVWVTALLGFTSPICISLVALAQRETHLTMNSRLSQLIVSERAGGVAEGRAEAKQ